MGAWMLVTGLASVFAGDFSSMVPEPSEGSAVTTNPVYSKLFIELGCGSLVVGVVLVLLTPFLRRLITDGVQAAPPQEPPVATDAAAA
jgi:POT family proton-dependent oligopeptide transporter